MAPTSRERARNLIQAWRKNNVKISEREVDSLTLAFEDVQNFNAMYHWLFGFACGVVVVVALSVVAWLVWR